MIFRASLGILFFGLVAAVFAQPETASAQASLICATSPKYETNGCKSVAPIDLKTPWTPPLPTDCPKGTFFDSAFGGECWSCPSGFIRSTKPVWGPDACWKAISEDLSPATKVGQHGCGSGTFFDLYDGGTCWSCPSGYNRTWDHVASKTACSKGIFGPFSRATRKGSAADCPSGSFFDPIDGGSCWSCPANYRRTLNPVNGGGACAKTIPTQYEFAVMQSNLGCKDQIWRPGRPRPFADILKRQCFACPTVDASTGEILITDKGFGSDDYTLEQHRHRTV